MTPERFNQISELYEAALQWEPDQRAAFLQQSCGGDTSLRQEVESLLASEESAEAFLSGKRMKAAVRASANETPPPLVGQKLDRYQVRSVLGVGGMGEVYRA